MRILFIVDNMDGHGVTISLLNLLKLLSPSKYDINLLVLNMTTDLYLKEIPDYVTLVPNDPGLEAYLKKFGESFKTLIKLREWRLLFFRFLVYLSKLKNGAVKSLQKHWPSIIKKRKVLPGEYDIAIGYQDYFSGIYAKEKIKAKYYVGWNHNIYEKMGYDNKLMLDYYAKLDRICTISNATKSSILATLGSELEKKLYIVPNALDVNKMKKLSCNVCDDIFFEKDNRLRILSIGRLVSAKGFDFSIEVAEELKKENMDFLWYIIGTGAEKVKLQKMIDDKELSDHVKLYGYANNPYPFLRHCDIYVQPSRYEGFGIAISEADYFNKPLIVTTDVEERFEAGEHIRILPFGNIDQWVTEILSVTKVLKGGKARPESDINLNDQVVTFFANAINFI